jgi:hypothetical protein
MFKWTTLVGTALACCLTMTAVNAGPDMGCLPPPLTQDYLKKTVRVEIKGKLEHVQLWLEGPRDPKFPTPNIAFLDYWQITVGGKLAELQGYTLEFGERKDITDLANKLVGKMVIVTGTLEAATVHVTGLKANEDHVKQTTEVEARGRLSAIYLETFKAGGFGNPDFVVPVAGWNFVVGGKTYNLAFATPELEQLARKLDDSAVILTGVMEGDTITVKSLKAAE